MDNAALNRFTRREFLSGASAVGAAALVGFPGKATAEPPLEIKKIRLAFDFVTCLAPVYLAEQLLRLEGFTDVQYVEFAGGGGTAVDILEKGQADLTLEPAPSLVYAMDRRPSILALAGIHSGCVELFGNDRVHAVRDLKGKTVAVYSLGGAVHVFLSSMLAYVGMDPRKDVTWLVNDKLGDGMRHFIEGRTDAILAFPPQPQELRAKKVGRVIINTAQDRPWSQYFCCMLVANQAFVANYPIATKRALRAVLKAADVCAQEPERAARYLVEKGHEPRYEVALEVLRSLPYDRWRQSDPIDTLRFHALRLHEVGIIKSDPNKLIAQGTDWRFLNELKRELKA